jgi:RES domain-containing protein
MTAREVRRGGVSLKLLESVEAHPFSGTVYRFIATRFLHSPLTSAGSKLHGGRFNPPGSFEVLYTALAVDTALAEREGILLTSTGIKLATGIRTSLLLRIDCHLASVLDLSDQGIRRLLKIPLATVVGPWLPWNTPGPSAVPTDGESGQRHEAIAPSQHLGLSVHASRRFEAVLSPSAKDPAGRCLAIFPDRLRPGSRVVIDDPHGAISGALGLGGS